MRLFFIVWRVIGFGDGEFSRFTGGLRGTAAKARCDIFCGSGGRGYLIIRNARGVDEEVFRGSRSFVSGDGTGNERTAKEENGQPK